jgi:dienelactone hydrolase
MNLPQPRRPRIRRAALLVFVLFAALAVRPVSATLRAASLLARFADEHASGALVDLGRHEVREEPATVETSRGPARARLYLPEGAADAPGVVLVHGVHRLGIDEPRLVRFARAVASSGVVVLTPEVQEIADYRVDPASIETIGAAARTLRARLGTGKAGVMGMSFAGGLALLAAADPRFADEIGFVVAVGAHADLARVSRFFATDAVEAPDGSRVPMHAHGYGALVMIYGNADRFFPAGDVDAAKDAIRLWLWDDHDAARARAEALGPEAWAKVDALFDGRIDLVAPELLAETERDHEAMERVSPHGKLGGVRAPVFLLHGAGDTVIPAAETAWLAAEVPADLLREALVSPAIVHVEMDAGTSASDEWALVRFMARVLEEADAAHG